LACKSSRQNEAVMIVTDSSADDAVHDTVDTHSIQVNTTANWMSWSSLMTLSPTHCRQQHQPADTQLALMKCNQFNSLTTFTFTFGGGLCPVMRPFINYGPMHNPDITKR